MLRSRPSITRPALRTAALRIAVLAMAGAASSEAQTPLAIGTWRPVADPTAGWHALGPVLLSVTAVAGFGTGDLEIPEPGTNFILAALEPGVYGGRASLIVAHWWGFQGGLVARGTAL